MSINRERWPADDGCVLIHGEDATKLQQDDIVHVEIDEADETDL